MNLDEIFDDWKNGYTHGELKLAHNLTDEQEFLITRAFENGFGNTAIRLALDKVKPGMTGAQLEALLFE